MQKFVELERYELQTVKLALGKRVVYNFSVFPFVFSQGIILQPFQKLHNSLVLQFLTNPDK